MNTYGGLLIPHCINCKFSESDPEMGYFCKEKNFLNVKNICSKYIVDADFVRREAEKFIERYSRAD